MLLIVTNETEPNDINNLTNLCDALNSRNIPFTVTKKCDHEIIKRTDILGIIIPGTSGKSRIHQYSIQPELDLELYYLFHFPKLPVLGICHGCQFLMVYYGGALLQYDSYFIGDKPTELDLSIEHLFKNCKKNQRMHVHFHDLPVVRDKYKDKYTQIKEIAWFTFRDNKRHACAFEFEKDRVYGVIFHPEVNKPSQQILYNFYYNISGGKSLL
jgi:GMP synthase-like glutamine amidotransferase